MELKEITKHLDELANLIEMKFTSGINNSKYVREAVILIQIQQKEIEEHKDHYKALKLDYQQLKERVLKHELFLMDIRGFNFAKTHLELVQKIDNYLKTK